MTRPTKTWLIALGVFAGYILVAVIIALVLKMHGPKMWQMIVALAVLGLLSAGIFLWFMRDTLRPPQAGTPASGVDATLAAARAQLVASRRVDKPRFGALPVLLVLGPDGSTKTTTIVRSGLEPELLAGDVFRGEAVAPTEGVNLWYSQGTVIVEAGGPLTADVPVWQRLVRALRPRSLLSALTGRAQSPRLALVCFGCDEFYRAGSGETVPAAARAIRERLGDAAKQFGVRLPTYIVFTKLDVVPHFDAFMRNFSTDEAREPLGAAVFPDSGSAGTYADRMTPQLDQAFDGLFVSLAGRRLQTLAREHGAEWKPGAYEFPREFNKVRALAIDFLREIGRPSELQVSPVLRGFYFTGVQAVFITETTPERAAPVAAQAQSSGARSATAVFGAQAFGQAPAVAPSSAGARKVPRWDFLPRVMREVVFGDQAAVRLTSAGARVNFWRRLGLGSAIGLAALLGFAFVWSYDGNKNLERAAADATRGIAALAPNPVDLPSLDALKKLDALRTQVDTLSAYTHARAPIGLRWGLYSGSNIYPDVRNAYFGGFNKLMFADTRAAMLATLHALPDKPRPTDDYTDTYGLLKAYIITTTHPDKSTPQFLAPALMTRWLAGRTIDTVRGTLARRQFETYANELRYSNPLPSTADAAAVAKARSFLRQFAGSESIYQYMLAEAAKSNPAIQFNRKFPGSAAYVVDVYEVPGAFTKGGATFMLDAFKTVDKFLTGENWVVGDEGAGVDKAKLVAELSARYATEFAGHWRKFLQSASVVRYSNVRDAAQKLTALSGNQSPLLALFLVASQNTNVPQLPDVAKAFQPVQFLTPPTVTDKLIGDKNAPYMNALGAFQSSVDATVNAKGAEAEQAAAKATGDAGTARNAAKQVASGFSIDPQGQVNSIVQNLMEAPIAYAEPLLKNYGAAEINGRARTFCIQARSLLAKFPFASDATAQASLADVTAVLRPVTGSLWQFYTDALAATLPRQGNQYVPNASGSVKLSAGFVQFMNRALAFSEIMFKDESPGPHLSFKAQPSPGDPFSSVTVTLDGETLHSRQGANLEQALINWPGAGQNAKLSAGSGGPEPTLVGPFAGPWAVFQLFNAADDWKQIPSGYRVGWELRANRGAGGAGTKVYVQIDTASTSPSALLVLKRGFFAGADCGGDIAK